MVHFATESPAGEEGDTGTDSSSVPAVPGRMCSGASARPASRSLENSPQ